MSTAGSRGTAGHSLSSIFISSSDDMAAGRDEDGVTKQGCSSSRARSAHDGSAGGCREGGGLSSSLHEISAHLRRNNVSLRFISRRILSVKQTARGVLAAVIVALQSARRPRARQQGVPAAPRCRDGLPHAREATGSAAGVGGICRVAGAREGSWAAACSVAVLVPSRNVEISPRACIAAMYHRGRMQS